MARMSLGARTVSQQPNKKQGRTDFERLQANFDAGLNFEAQGTGGFLKVLRLSIIRAASSSSPLARPLPESPLARLRVWWRMIGKSAS